MLRLMCVTAHPDDESGAFGGTLRLYSERGVETFVLCLTPGQAASNRGGAQSDADLAAMRRKEFDKACEILHVSNALVLDYPDGQLHRQDLYKVVADITRRVREFRPHVLITFGAEGGITGHTDHSMVSVFATLAFHWAGRENRFPDQLQAGLKPHVTQKLYYVTHDFALPNRPPVLLPPASAVIDITPWVQAKIDAFKAHSSQGPLLVQFEKAMRGRVASQELFHLMARGGFAPIAPETDLFAGVTA